MTPVVAPCDGDWVGLSVTGGVAHFPGLAKERIVPLDALGTERVAALVAAANAASFFTRIEPRQSPVRPDARTWHLRLSHNGRSRLLALSEPLDEPALSALLWVVRDCLRVAGR